MQEFFLPLRLLFVDDHFHSGVFQHIQGLRVAVHFADHDPLHARRDRVLGAMDAGAVFGIKRRAFSRRPGDARGLEQGIVLAVHGADAVAVFEEVANFIAGRQSRRRAIIAGRDDAVVLGEDGAGIEAVAVATGGDDLHDRHKIVIPVWPVMLAFFAHAVIIVGRVEACQGRAAADDCLYPETFG